MLSHYVACNSYKRCSDLLRPSLIHMTFYYKETMFKSKALSTEYDEKARSIF